VVFHADSTEVTGISLQNISTYLTHLTHLEYCNFTLSNESLILASQSCVKLQHLLLSDEYNNITDYGMTCFQNNFPLLQSLTLSYFEQITDLTINYLSSSLFALHLKKLCLRRIIKITNISLLKIARSFPNLEYLSLQECNRLSIKGIQKMLKLINNHLKTFGISKRLCKGISENNINKFKIMYPNIDIRLSIA